MCGIIGYTGIEKAIPKLISGLTSLEYRGYDSAGVSFFQGSELLTTKAKGRIANLKDALIKSTGKTDFSEIDTVCGIGHTRWATHGEPSDINSHPHCTDNLSLVHNGIIENYLNIKQMLSKYNYTTVSQTDTEIAAKLIDYYYVKLKDPVQAIFAAVDRLRGSYALGILFKDYPGKIFAIRKDSPLIVAMSDEGSYIASDIPAFLKYTNRHFRLEENELAILDGKDVTVYNVAGDILKKEILEAAWNVDAAEKEGFAHFMLKEIHEEPTAIRKTVASVKTSDLSSILSSLSSVYIVGCGTAMHAGLIGKFMIENLARIPVTVAIASEFRYQNPIIDHRDLVILISQSGETADTVAALRLAKSKGARTLAVVNVIGSTVAREADSIIMTMAGPEISVASTKAYSSQISVMYPLAIDLAVINKKISDKTANEMLEILEDTVPELVEKVISDKGSIEKIAELYYHAEDVFFIGRGIDNALTQEGSLKLKEISYIHSEAYAAGELKHGTISLISDGVPVIAVATNDSLFEKTMSNVKEVKTRGAKVILLCSKTEEEFSDSDTCDTIIRLPKVPDLTGDDNSFAIRGENFSPFTVITVLQTFAYYMAVKRGCDVDRPRNLAKSVTVE